jgi:hypothetical protein
VVCGVPLPNFITKNLEKIHKNTQGI